MDNDQLFNKLDKLIRENGGYIDNRYSQIFVENKIKDFKESINAFTSLANRKIPDAPLKSFEHALAETYKKGLDCLFENNKKLSSPKVLKDFIKILADTIGQIPTGLGRRILWDTTNEFFENQGIKTKSKKKDTKKTYKYLDLKFDTPGSGLNDTQITKIITPLIDISKDKDLQLVLGKGFFEQFKKQILDLTKGLTGNNILKDDILLNAKLNLLIKWFNLNKKKFSTNTPKATNLLTKIEICIKDGKNFFKNNLFKKYKHPSTNDKKSFHHLISNKPKRFIKNLLDNKKKDIISKIKSNDQGNGRAI